MEEVVDRLADSGVGGEDGALFGHGEAAGQVHLPVAGGGGDGAGENAEQGGLPGSVVADDGDTVLWADNEVDPVEHGPVGESHGEFAQGRSG